jgi:transposase
MFVRTKPIANSARKRVQICACYRMGDKVKQKVIRHVGIAENDSHLEELKKLAEAIKLQLKEELEGPYLFDLKPFQSSSGISVPKDAVIPVSKEKENKKASSEKTLVNVEALKEESRVVDGFHDVFGTLFNQFGFNKVLGKSQCNVLQDVVLARIASPASKLATQHILAADFGREIDLDRIYRMMDALQEQKDVVQKTVFTATEQLCFGKVDFLLFDVTTLYFESTNEDEMRTFGWSKDQKFHSVQVVLALATTSNGLPIGYQLFAGNTTDVSTLVNCIDNWKKIMPIGDVRIVADRAMMSEKNIQFLEEKKIGYVIAAKLRKQPKDIREEILSSRKDCSGIVVDKVIEGRRLVATFSSERQAKDIKDRTRILEKISKKIGKGKNAKKLVSNSGYQKYLSYKGEADLFISDEKVAQDAAWDGYHGIITNCTSESAEELLAYYRRLWVIEESFRIQKHNLSLRPIYHFKPERIEAHILICYIAFALMRHLEFRIGIQKEAISMNQMRSELWRVQSSYLKDMETGKKYRLPSSMSVLAKKIYQAMGIKRSATVQEM